MITTFCQKCGSILIPKKKDRKTLMVCSCGYKEKNKESLIIKETIKEQKSDKIEVVEKKVEILPKIKEDCPKCTHHEAFYWLVQTRAADEAPTRFFKCVKCDHSWRAYD